MTLTPIAEPADNPTPRATVEAPAVTTPAELDAPIPTTEPVVEEIVAPAKPPDLGYLKAAFDERLRTFDGIASYYARDLRGGQVAVHNGDLAISGTSVVKIPIMLETFRVLDEAPSITEMRLITETAMLSGNYTANLLLELIAGRPDPFAGAQKVTESLRELGLYNTFIAVPYDLSPNSGYFATYLTPANQRRELWTNPDSSMQTTVADMGELLAMIYECALGQGYLLERRPGALTAGECRELIDIMRANDIDAFIEEGVPPDVPVAHKHGWVGETHSDAALVQHPEYPYVLVITLHRPGWLEWAESTEIIGDLSRLAFSHFDNADVYAADLLAQGPALLLTAIPTPNLQQAIIRGTGGAGLVLRHAPEGEQTMIVPEGSLVFLLDDAAQTVNGRSWRHIRLRDEIAGWVVADFLEIR